MDLPEQNKCGKKVSFLLSIILLFFIINRSNPCGRKRGYCCLGNKLFAYQTLREKRPYSEFSGPHFPAFGLNTERNSVSVSIRMRENASTDIFYGVRVLQQNLCMAKDGVTFRLVWTWLVFVYISFILFIHFIILMDYLTSIFTIVKTILN